MPYRILLTADHAWRDVPGVSAVRVELERLMPDCLVVVADIHLFPQLVQTFKPHLVTLPHMLDKERNRVIDTVRRRGGLCAIVPNENRPNSETLMKRDVEADYSLCDLYCAWTDTFSNKLPATVNRAVTGCARWDFYCHPYSSLVADEQIICAKYGLDPRRKIITIASSFPNAKFHKSNTSFAAQDWKNLKVPVQDTAEEAFKSEWLAFQQFKAWVRILRYEVPDVQLVVKPHPFEGVADWKAFCDEIGAAFMPCDYIYSLLAISDLHVARVDCVTVPEAWITGTPTVQCDLGEVGKSGSGMEAKDFHYLASNVEALLAAASQLGGPPPEMNLEVDPYLEKWMGPRPGSARRIAAAIAKLLEHKTPRTVTEPATEDLVNVNKLLRAHSSQNAVPQVDYAGHWGKSVTLDVTNEWVRNLRALAPVNA